MWLPSGCVTWPMPLAPYPVLLLPTCVDALAAPASTGIIRSLCNTAPFRHPNHHAWHAAPTPRPPLCYCTWLRLHFLNNHECKPPPGHIPQVAVYISPHQVHGADRGLVVVGASVMVRGGTRGGGGL